MDEKSFDIKQVKINQLRQLFPEVVTENQVDWEKLKATLGEDINFEDERYVLNWAGKSNAFRVLQAPTTATLIPAREESVNFDQTQHVFIEGENLEVLKVLQKAYYGKIKMIYIDPPYNTGNDHFIYPDKFSETKDEYLKRIGDKDELGYLTSEGLFRKNSKDSGHYHSNWLSMMYPRLFLARNLLRDDGVIFISIDDNEVHNLRLEMNEIFGEENFIAKIIWEGAIKNDSKFVSVSHDYVVCYAKNIYQLKDNDNRWRTRKEGIDSIYEKIEELKKEFKNDYEKISTKLKNWFNLLPKNNPAWQHRHYNKVDKNGVYFPGDISWPGGGGPIYTILHPSTKKPVLIPRSGWRFSSREKMAKAIEEERIEFGKDENKVPTLKRYLHETEGQVLPSVIYQDRRSAMQRQRQLLERDIFENPKDENILRKIADAVTKEDDIILDFFAGSATTAHAVIKLNLEDNANRKFIMVQLPEQTDENSEAYKTGYKTIAEIGKERIRRVIKKIKEEQEKNQDLFSDEKSKLDLGFKVFKLQPSNFKIWWSDQLDSEAGLAEQLEVFVDPTLEKVQEKNMLYELLLKSGFDLNSKIIDNGDFYLINDNEMALALAKIDEAIVRKIIALRPRKVITLDKLFMKNDQLKTNTALQMKDARIDFRTI